MRVKDLIILLFPPQDNPDDEVMKSGRALFAKHLRKNLLGKKEPNNNTKAMLQELDKRRQDQVADDSAQQAWLIQVHHKEKDFTGAVEEGTQFIVLAGTTKFDPKTLSQDSTGVYVVAHCQESLMNVFKHHAAAQGEGDYNDRIADAAAKLVDFFVKLGLKTMTKLCLVACKTVPDNRIQKDTLECLVMGLHEKDLHPLIAGWDIPIAVNVDEKSPDYGRKQRTGPKPTLLANERKKHKFVYKYEIKDGFFDIKEASQATDAVKMGMFNKVLKTKDFYQKGEIVGAPTPTFPTDVLKGKGVQVKWELAFVRGMKYTPANWSAGK
jgi:hypothetical protein